MQEHRFRWNSSVTTDAFATLFDLTVAQSNDSNLNITTKMITEWTRNNNKFEVFESLMINSNSKQYSTSNIL